VLIGPVSADCLSKTVIFAETAGDFPGFRPQDRQSGSPETEANARKAGISGPFSRLLGSLAERWSAWLPWEGSNSHIPDCISACEISKGISPRKPPFYARRLFGLLTIDLGAWRLSVKNDLGPFFEHWMAPAALCSDPHT